MAKELKGNLHIIIKREEDEKNPGEYLISCRVDGEVGYEGELNIYRSQEIELDSQDVKDVEKVITKTLIPQFKQKENIHTTVAGSTTSGKKK